MKPYNIDMAKLLYQGHASLRFETDSGKFIYVDPYAGEGYDKVPDLVLITHEHYDHNAVDRLQLGPRSIVIRSADALQNGIYYDFEYYGVKIQALPASNANHPIDQCVGYLLEIDGKRVYIAGDTSYLPSMDNLSKENLDYAFLPIDGIYNMGPEEASRVASIIRPKHLIPYHGKPGMLFDMTQTMKVTYEGAMLVRPGQTITL